MSSGGILSFVLLYRPTDCSHIQRTVKACIDWSCNTYTTHNMSDFEYPALDDFRKTAKKILAKHKSAAGHIQRIADVRQASNKALESFKDSDDFKKKVKDIREAYENTTMLPEMRNEDYTRVKIDLVENSEVGKFLNTLAADHGVNFDFSDYRRLPAHVRPKILYITAYETGQNEANAPRLLVGSDAARDLSVKSGISIGDILIKFPGHKAFSVYGPDARKIGQMFVAGRKSKTMRKGIRDEEAKIVADVIVRVTGGYGLMSAVTGLNLASHEDLVKFPNPHASAVGSSGIAQLALAGSGAYGSTYKDLKAAKEALEKGQHLRYAEEYKSAKQRTGLRANKGLVWDGAKWEETHKFVRGGPRPICHPGISKRMQQTRIKDGACASMGRRLSSVKKDTAALSIPAAGRVTANMWEAYYDKASQKMQKNIAQLIDLWNASADRKTPIKYALRAITLYQLSKIKGEKAGALGDMVISGVAVGNLSKEDLLYLAGGLLRVAKNVGFESAPSVDVGELEAAVQVAGSPAANGHRDAANIYSSKEFVGNAVTGLKIAIRLLGPPSFKERAATRAARAAAAAPA